jgi:hypothetical protein
LLEWCLAGETKVLEENLPQCRFIHHKPHMHCPDANPGRWIFHMKDFVAQFRFSALFIHNKCGLHEDINRLSIYHINLFTDSVAKFSLICIFLFLWFYVLNKLQRMLLVILYTTSWRTFFLFFLVNITAYVFSILSMLEMST